MNTESGAAGRPGRRAALTLGAAALFVCALLLALGRAVSFGSIGGVRLAAPAAMSDFKSTVYYPAKAFAEGANPYDAQAYLARYPAPEPIRLYPPAMMLVSQPYAALELDVATVLHAALTLALSGVLALVALRLGGITVTARSLLLTWALILLSRPGQWNLLLGQTTLWVVLGTYAAFAAPRQASMQAGVGLAIALLKPNFGLGVAALMLARGQMASAAIGLGLSGMLNLVALLRLVEASGGAKPLAELMLSNTARYQAPSGAVGEFTVFRVDTAALGEQLFGAHLGLGPTFLLAGVLLALTSAVLRRRAPSSSTSDGAMSDAFSAGLLCSAVLVSIYHIGYDLLLLTWPFVALVRTVAADPAGSPLRRWLALALLALLAGNYVSTFSVIQGLGVKGPLLTLLTSVNGLALLGLLAFYMYEVAVHHGKERGTGSEVSTTAAPILVLSR